MSSKLYKYLLSLNAGVSDSTCQLNVKDDTTKIEKNLRSRVKKVLVLTTVVTLVTAIALATGLYVRSHRSSEKKSEELKRFASSFIQEDDGKWPLFFNSSSRLGVYSNAAVSTCAAPCAPVGRKILEKGGSAVDAAIATLVCMGAVNPQSSGLGGGFLMLVHSTNRSTVTFIDAREMAPLNADELTYQRNATFSKIGPLSIAVPGEVIGYHAAHVHFGKLPWSDLFQPTIEMCRKGIPVTEHLADKLDRESDKILAREPLRNIFTNNKTGKLYKMGEIMTRYDLANTLEIIAKDGAKALYGIGQDLSTRFVQDLKEMGSLIGADDLIMYSPRSLATASVKLRNNMTMFSVGLPGSGAIMGMMLSVLDGYNMSSKTTQSKKETMLALHRMVETFKFAYARRMELEDYPDNDYYSAMKEMMNNLTSPEYAAFIRAQIDDNKAYDDPRHYRVQEIQEATDHGTAHAVVVAPNGDAVTVTSTINYYFGSMEVSKSTGIILNNEMDDFSIPDSVSYYGVLPSQKNRVRPTKRPLSSISATIVRDENRNVRLAIGGNGGITITSAVLQTTLYNLIFGKSIKEAIDAPRLHHQLIPTELKYEKDFPKNVLEVFKCLGHKLEEMKGMMSIVNGISRDENGTLYANADYRKKGDVDGY